MAARTITSAASRRSTGTPCGHDRTALERSGGQRGRTFPLARRIALAVFAQTSNASRGSTARSAIRGHLSQSLSVLRNAKRFGRICSPRAASWSASGDGRRNQRGLGAAPLRGRRPADARTVHSSRPAGRAVPAGRALRPARAIRRLANEAREMGFRAVASGPLVRTSFRAGQLFEQARKTCR